MKARIQGRQVCALVFAFWLCFDVCNQSSVIWNVSSFHLAIHFIYFQLPVKSRALTLFHPLSIVAACVSLAEYLALLQFRPDIEQLRIDEIDGLAGGRELALGGVLIHHVLPIFLHFVDLSIFDMKAKFRKIYPAKVWQLPWTG